jgi:hypothetical protein
MLNPSVADEECCDPTLQRCIHFSKQWGYGGMYIVNLFSYISTDPNVLKTVNDPIGPNTNEYIIRAASNSDKIIFAWGQRLKGTIFQSRVNEVINLLKDYPQYCIEKTKYGIPRHPLYLKSNLQPLLF